jgi:hypothetical protein
LQLCGAVTKVAGSIITICCWAAAFAPLHADDPAGRPSPHLVLVNRFIQNDRDELRDYRALRRLEATNDKFNKQGWIEAWTELTPGGMKYEIVDAGGSDYIRSKVLEAALKNEQKLLARGVDRADFTLANYEFGETDQSSDGLIRVVLKPRRSDQLLIRGVMFLNPRSGDLVRVEGALAKSPSFWTKRVEIVREYRRIGTTRVPVRVDSMADVKIAGESRFVMTYQYQRINGQVVGAPTALARRSQ